jgi:hypothetical protein
LRQSRQYPLLGPLACLGDGGLFVWGGVERMHSLRLRKALPMRVISRVRLPFSINR